MKNSNLLLLLILPIFSFAQQHWTEKVAPSLLEEYGQFPFLIQIKGQADLSEAIRFRFKEEKGTYVVNALRNYAKESQADIIDIIESKPLPYQSFYIVNGIWVYANRQMLELLAKHPSVSFIYPDEHFVMEEVFEERAEGGARATEWGLNKINAPAVWALGHTGQGVIIGGQDTGYEWDHSALKNHYRGWNGTTADHDYNWHDAIHAIDVGNSGSNPCGLDSTFPCDDHNHGTHTMGTMTGDDGAGNQIGVAPGAKWIGCRNMERGDGTLSTYVECFEWFLAPYPVGSSSSSGNPSKAPHVINNSWGCPPSEGCSAANWGMMETAINNLRAAGVVVVVSAGNAGSNCGTVKDPAAIFDGSFSIGATNSSDAIAGFSSRGPVTVDGSNRRKPDVAAPGVSVRSSVRGGGYSSFSGTSMAGPHVVGAIALMIDAVPALAGQVEMIETLLESTAIPQSTSNACGGDTGASQPNHTYGFGRIDVMAAIAEAVLLPVELLSFSAKIEQKNIRLLWETANEINNDYFGIEYSRDGKNYIEIDRIEASKGVHELLEYSYLHKDPDQGTHYYRLKQTDYDGKSAWYGPITVKLNRHNIVLSPNPIVDILNIKGIKSPFNISIYDTVGRCVIKQSIHSSNNKASLDLSTLLEGMYLITIENNQERISKKVLKF